MKCFYRIFIFTALCHCALFSGHNKCLLSHDDGNCGCPVENYYILYMLHVILPLSLKCVSSGASEIFMSLS
jgi:hypothetical protein